MIRKLVLTAFAATALLAACHKAGAPAPGATAANAPPVAKPADPGNPTVNDWQGSWDAPDGHFIRITRLDQGYEVVIKDAGGAQSFHGDDDGDVLKFERNGVTDTIRTSDGKGTGVAGLEGRNTCLVIRPGEGFCRAG
jgi:glucose/arabinose dehydrogenase